MDQKVEISRSALAGLLLALVACLMTVAFMLGRQTAPQVAVAATPARSIALVAALTPGPTTAEKTSEARIASQAIPTRREPVTVKRPSAPEPVVANIAPPLSEPAPVKARPAHTRASDPKMSSTDEPRTSAPAAEPRTSAPAAKPRTSAPAAEPRPSEPAPEPPKAAGGDQEAVRRYLAQVDKVMAGTQSVGDANAFATELLQQSMQGDSSGFDQLLETSRNALSDLQAIKPPPSCKEHHTLMVRQVKDGIGLLSKVGSATASMDATSLSSLALQGKDMQGDIARLQKLDRELRSSL